MRELFPELSGNSKLKEMLARRVASPSPSVSHAYILEGEEGAGRNALAKSVCAALACQHRTDGSYPLPCGECPSCRKIRKGICPDITEIGIDEGKTGIGIDSVRQLRDDVCFRPTELDYRFFIIRDAGSMTVQAQNALLLTLEEPPSYAVFFLIVNRADELLETVVSRSQTLRLEKTAEPDTGSDTADAQKDAREFIRLVSERKNAAAMISLTAAAGGKRDKASLLLAAVIGVIRELLAAKTGDTVDGTSADAADAMSTKRILALYDAAAGAASALERNANIRLTLMNMLSDAGII